MTVALTPWLGPLAAVVGSAIGTLINGGTWKSFAIGIGIGIAAGAIAGAMGFSGPDMFATGFKFTTETIMQGVIAGAVTGAVSGAISSAVYGGNWGNNIGQGAMGGAIGAAVAMTARKVFGDIDSSIGTTTGTTTNSNTPDEVLFNQCEIDLENQRTGEIITNEIPGVSLEVVKYNEDGSKCIYLDDNILNHCCPR